MPAQQRTFDLIPTTLVKSNVYRPPTTSKAAKKAYQQANKGLRVSRAEQRRRDPAELERQKKEYEREKAAAKAKAAREKKAAKAHAEKEERKRKGLPEPSKFVRASQPTISRFVWSENGKKRWQDVGTDCVEEDSDDTITEGLVEGKKEEPAAEKVMVDEASEDEFGEFPSLSQTDILEIIDSSLLVVKNATSPERRSGPAHDFIYSHESPALPRRRAIEDQFLVDDSEENADMVTTQLLSEAADAALKSDAFESQFRSDQSPSDKKPATTQQSYNNPREVSTVNNQDSRGLPSMNKTIQTRSSNMPPPPNVPVKRSLSFAFNQPKSAHLPLTTLAKPNFSVPSSSTQAFLEAHIDDFFPSPSQEIRELLDVIDDDDLSSNTQIAMEISPEKYATGAVKPREPILPSISKPVFKSMDDFENLLCTQDLMFSSQELAEITTPSRLPPAPKPRVLQSEPMPPEPKRRYFEEKDEDRGPRLMSEMNLKLNRKLEPELPKTKRPFFEEKEEDLFRAAIYESKREAEWQAQQSTNSRMFRPMKATTRAMQRPQRSTLSQGQQQVLLREESQKVTSRVSKEMQKVPLQEQKNSGRTLTRVQSTATDYGDDDFCGCSQELLAMC